MLLPFSYRTSSHSQELHWNQYNLVLKPCLQPRSISTMRFTILAASFLFSALSIGTPIAAPADPEPAPVCENGRKLYCCNSFRTWDVVAGVPVVPNILNTLAPGDGMANGCSCESPFSLVLDIKCSSFFALNLKEDKAYICGIPDRASLQDRCDSNIRLCCLKTWEGIPLLVCRNRILLSTVKMPGRWSTSNRIADGDALGRERIVHWLQESLGLLMR